MKALLLLTQTQVRLARASAAPLLGLALTAMNSRAADLIDDFDGTTLNTAVWEQIGDKIITVANSRLTWADNGGNWADGEISPIEEFYLPGDYGNDQAVGYRSPIIDFTGIPAAVLQFYHYYDFELEADIAYDWGELLLLNATGQSLLPAEALRFEGASGGWRRVTLPLPPEALGQPIRLEFKLFSDVLNSRPGWYIDDLLVD